MTGPLRTARDRARLEITGEILATARRHLAEHGAAGLSLRAVARDLELVPSAVYRYFDNRDALLTALIVDSYDSLGDAAEAAALATARRRPRDRWVATAEAIRAWARERPHEYALLYGSPVPGYEAPDDTVQPGTRVSFALMRIVRDAHVAGTLRPATLHGQPSAAVQREMARLAALADVALAPDTWFAALLAWTQLFGLISFELFGQTRGLVDEPDAFFRDAARTMAEHIGL